MKYQRPPRRAFLFLQGPPGPFFWLLAEEIRKRGCAVHRINLNGGDKVDWPGEASDYRGRGARWALHVDAYMRRHAITDLILYGDCRPMHMAAHQMARLRRINVHVFEEGYIRPDWMTLEPDGVNGHSRLSRDPEWFLERAKSLPPLPGLPPITASFRRRARDAYWYYHRVIVGRLLLRFPFYRAHRPGSILMEGFGWLHKFSRRKRNDRLTAEALARIEGESYFLFPLQLSSDYQIRVHSPFSDMREAVDYVLQSFAAHAPSDVTLVVKEHPLECSFFDWRRFVDRRARRLGVAARVIYVAGGDLSALARESCGMVTVNSTSATFALSARVPVCALGSAIYNIRGITHQGLLDDFWIAPQMPDARVYDAFQRVLHDRCLVRGGIASKSATRILVESTMKRLFEDPAHIPAAPLASPDDRSAASSPYFTLA